MPKSGRDPSLDIFLKARGKNNVAENRLRKELSSLETERQNKQLLLNIDLYEQRRLAYEYEREVTDIQFKNDYLESCQQDTERRTDMTQQKTDVVESAKSKRGIPYPIGNEPLPKIPLNFTFKPKDTTQCTGEEHSSLQLPKVANQFVKENSKVSLNEACCPHGDQLAFPSLRILMRSEIGPRRTVQSGKCSRSGEQLPDINSREPTSVHGMSLGNPQAIKSVRRLRREASDLMTTRRCHEEERKCLRELSSSSMCSKGVPRNWQIKELEKSYSSVPMLVPALDQVRENLRKSQGGVNSEKPANKLSTFKLRRCLSDRNVSRPKWKFVNLRAGSSFRDDTPMEAQKRNRSGNSKLTESMPELNHI